MVGHSSVSTGFFGILLVATATALKVPVTAPTKPHQQAPAVATAEQVETERKTLSSLATKLDTLLDDKTGSLRSSKVSPALKLFAQKLRSVLEETKHIKDPKIALQKLRDARAGVKDLSAALSARQEALMKDDSAQKESLLLGVLLTRQAEPMAKQLEVLKSADFANLDVSKALLNKHDDKAPLYVQAGAYLDEHKGKAGSAAGNPMATVVASLQQREGALQQELDARTARQAKISKRIEELEKTTGKRGSRILKMQLKRSQHTFKKWAAMRKTDIASMQDAIVGVKKGDMKAVQRARDALMQSLKNMQSQNAGFIVLIQQANTMLEEDCPYCVAQCVGKCHSGGKTYATCLGQCADAGKA